jgi:hypothetical protein
VRTHRAAHHIGCERIAGRALQPLILHLEGCGIAKRGISGNPPALAPTPAL